MIIKINLKLKYIQDKLLPIWGGKDRNLALNEKLRLETATDKDTSTILN